MNVVYHKDCLPEMREMKDNQFDLAIVDPPYGIGADNMTMGTNMARTGDGYPAESTATRLKKNRLNTGSGKLKNRTLNRSDCSWDVAPPHEYFEQLFRVSKNQIIWGGNYFNLPPTRGIVVWDKQQPWENFSQCELAWTSFDVPAKVFRYSNTGGANAIKKIHPTQKPIALYAFLIRNFTDSDTTILDTHVGSGSSRIAAWIAGLNFTGYEIAQTYWGDQEKRFAIYQRQQQLFTPEQMISNQKLF